jgi:enamine deaminase RidA (YjgF/YER057c/UK114 family)
MIPFEVIGVLPPPGGTPARQAEACLGTAAERLQATGRRRGDVLSLTFFVDATDPAGYWRRRAALLAKVGDAFDGSPPPASVVAQPPERGRRVALEATLLAPGTEAKVSRRTCDGLPYTVVTSGGLRQVHAGGLCSNSHAGDTAAKAKEAFARMRAILGRQRMTFGHVVRQWSYIECVHELGADGRESSQGYQAFNDVRTLAYARSGFPAGYPAATGIGQAAGGVVIEFIALDTPPDVRVVPLSNPRQVDAHRYSDGVLVGEPLGELDDKSAPKFERGKLVARGDAEVVFVSGTAAILGEKSVAPGDVAAQTRTTIENIAVVAGEEKLTHLRAYVKRARDIPVVRRVCEAAYGPIPALYLRADVCRAELLVEIEGLLARSTEEIGGPR